MLNFFVPFDSPRNAAESENTALLKTPYQVSKFTAIHETASESNAKYGPIWSHLRRHPVGFDTFWYQREIAYPKNVLLFLFPSFPVISAYANSTDISTSAAVIEIRFAYILVFLAMSKSFRLWIWPHFTGPLPPNGHQFSANHRRNSFDLRIHFLNFAYRNHHAIYGIFCNVPCGPCFCKKNQSKWIGLKSFPSWLSSFLCVSR